MKRTWKSLIFALALSVSLSVPAAAGSWQQDNGGYWYQNDDGSYAANCWQWIDGNQDNIAECYCFNENGYLFVSTTTPDGCTVDGSGAWTVNGIVQTKVLDAGSAANSAVSSADNAVSSANSAASSADNAVSSANSTVSSAGTSQTAISSVPYDGYTIIVNTNTKKYHIPSCYSAKKIKQSNLGYSDNSAALDALGYAPCKNCH